MISLGQEQFFQSMMMLSRKRYTLPTRNSCLRGGGNTCIAERTYTGKELAKVCALHDGFFDP
jgi:hypothetical protein